MTKKIDKSIAQKFDRKVWIIWDKYIDIITHKQVQPVKKPILKRDLKNFILEYSKVLKWADQKLGYNHPHVKEYRENVDEHYTTAIRYNLKLKKLL